MQTIASQLDKAFRKAIADAFSVDAEPLIALSMNEKFGDYQSNAAMGLAKILTEKTGQKSNPRQIAEQIKGKLDLGEMASEVSIAGPGFLNVRLNPAWLNKTLGKILGNERLGIAPVDRPATVVVDYSGPNIAKELHVGHLRSTIIGDAVSRVIEFEGHKVIRQNHIGDWGTQFGMLIAELMHRAGDLQDKLTQATAAGAESIQFKWLSDLEEFYRTAKKHFDEDAAFQDEARRMVVSLQAGDQAIIDRWRVIVGATQMHYLPLYGRLGVKLRAEDERGESSYNPMLPRVIADLKAKGIAIESQGATVVPIEGFENPLIIEKTGGGYLYGTTDLAAIRYRVGELHADRVIYFVDSRQSQHFTQVFAAARKASWAGSAVLEHAAFGTMLGEDGKPFKSRSGGLVKLAELLDEAEDRAYALVTKLMGEKGTEVTEEQKRTIAHAVGIGALKYADLAKDRISDYLFSFDKMLAMDGNTAPYLQYAYARIKSIFRRAVERGISQADTGMQLASPFELALAKHILRLGETIEVVSRELKPHHLCAYLFELASKFSGFFENCPVLQSEEPMRSSRLALCDLTARTMALGLDLLGIEHPEQM